MNGPSRWRDADGVANDVLETNGGAMEAYCLKCRDKCEMKDAAAVTMKNGKPATRGLCAVCGTRMYKIGKAA